MASFYGWGKLLYKSCQIVYIGWKKSKKVSEKIRSGRSWSWMRRIAELTITQKGGFLIAGQQAKQRRQHWRIRRIRIKRMKKKRRHEDRRSARTADMFS
ncbi:MAG: hypothetical protein HFG93_05760 [Dorea sp.]|jgi:hypothetical protein|nr:hypothetical protein [Dorea sp.]